MKKYLLPESGNFYKANLHSHSTITDGRWTPEEVKQRYMEQGYSVVAYTDHHFLVTHNELTDENFIALNGLEIGAINGTDKTFYKNCDFGLIALDPNNTGRPHWNNPDNPTLMKFDPDFVNAVLTDSRQMGYFVTLNHPTWSLLEYTDYINYNGMHAMEIYNHSSRESGYDEHNAKIYNDMLRNGKRLYCIATDDNHCKPERPDYFGGFTMIKAEKLEYRHITDALLNGDFYASEGPLINNLWYEDGKVHISTSPVKEITITKPNRNINPAKGKGSMITEASFSVEETDGYFFITAIAEDGAKAYTNAYFLDELLTE